MKQAGLGDQVKKAKAGRCPMCGTPIDITTFKDELSLREYSISGVCQACQDDIFG